MCAVEMIKMFFISIGTYEIHRTMKGLLFFAPTPAFPLIRPNCWSVLLVLFSLINFPIKNVCPKVMSVCVIIAVQMSISILRICCS